MEEGQTWMSERIRFHRQVPSNERPGITAYLAAFADAGFEVNVDPPELAPDLGWVIYLDRPGKRASFSVQPHATERDWAAIIAGVMVGLAPFIEAGRSEA
jgi:hypothetical protein